MGYLTDQKHSDQYYNKEDNVDNNLNKSKVNSQNQNVCYYSNIIGQYICDPITNAKYPWKVGSLDERRLFKVTNTTGNLYNKLASPYSNYAYYETPYAYMNHRNVELHEDIINDWYEKVKKLYPD